jgi:hypothetical protein
MEEYFMNGTAQAIETEKKKKKKVKTEKVWTQSRLKKLWNDAWGMGSCILRQPRNEICVFESTEYLGTRRVKNNTYGGAYDAHYWRVGFLSQNSMPREFPNCGALEIPCSKWSKNTKMGNIQLEPQDMIGIYTVTVDRDGSVFVLEEGNKLELS